MADSDDERAGLADDVDMDGAGAGGGDGLLDEVSSFELHLVCVSTRYSDLDILVSSFIFQAALMGFVSCSELHSFDMYLGFGGKVEKKRRHSCAVFS